MPISAAELEKWRKKIDDSLEELGKKVDGLLTTRIWLLAICGVLAAFGINGQFVLNDVKGRVATLNKSMDEAQVRVKELNSEVQTLSEKLSGTIKSLTEEAKTELQKPLIPSKQRSLRRSSFSIRIISFSL